MQKKLIALAIAGLASSAAFAQTNVTIYGVMDLSLETVKTSGSNAGTDVANTQRVSSNSSLIGFKGTEDLGNGLSAIFQIETNLNPDANGAPSGALLGSTRDTFVGLKGDSWGMVQAGTLTGPTRALAANVEFSPGWTTNAITSAITGAIGGFGTGADSRMTNSILYTTPAYGAFSFQAGYGTGEVHSNATGQNAHTYTLGATYADGPLYVGYAYMGSKDITAPAVLAPAAFGDVKVHKIGAKYAFPTGTTVSALYDRAEAEDTSVTALGEVKRNAWMLGVNQAFGGVQNVWLQYAKANDLSGSLCGGACGSTDAKQITLGWSYTMSKRTMLHAYYTKLSNNTNTALTSYDLAVNPVGIVTPGDGADPRSMGFGLRHAF